MKCIAYVGEGKAKRPCAKEAAPGDRHCKQHAIAAAKFLRRMSGKGI